MQFLWLLEKGSNFIKKQLSQRVFLTRGEIKKDLRKFDSRKNENEKNRYLLK